MACVKSRAAAQIGQGQANPRCESAADSDRKVGERGTDRRQAKRSPDGYSHTAAGNGEPCRNPWIEETER